MKPCNCSLTVSSVVGSLNVSVRPRLHECKKRKQQRTGVKIGGALAFMNQIKQILCTFDCLGQLLVFILA